MPNVLNISSAVRATRVLPDVTFTAALLVAIMYVDGITGTVTALIRRIKKMASTRTSTYSPSDVNVVISQESTGLIHVVAGYAEDSHGNVERDSETYEHVTGVDNIATRVYKANTSGKVTVSLGQGSASNDILTMLYLNDKASRIALACSPSLLKMALAVL